MMIADIIGSEIIIFGANIQKRRVKWVRRDEGYVK